MSSQGGLSILTRWAPIPKAAGLTWKVWLGAVFAMTTLSALKTAVSSCSLFFRLLRKAHPSRIQVFRCSWKHLQSANFGLMVEVSHVPHLCGISGYSCRNLPLELTGIEKEAHTSGQPRQNLKQTHSLSDLLNSDTDSKKDSKEDPSHSRVSSEHPKSYGWTNRFFSRPEKYTLFNPGTSFAEFLPSGEPVTLNPKPSFEECHAPSGREGRPTKNDRQFSVPFHKKSQVCPPGGIVDIVRHPPSSTGGMAQFEYSVRLST